MLQYLSSSYRLLPSQPGVYIFLDKNNNVLYVGKAKNLQKRVASYFVNNTLLEGKTKQLVSLINSIKVSVVESEIEALLLEANYIKKFLPKYNSRLTDGKAYPVIRITIKNEFPAIIVARKQDDPKSLYFGPYPNAGSVRMVLKMLRKIFPFQSTLHHPKHICLYYHLGLCPCTPIFNSSQQKKKYKKNIRHIAEFLRGQKKKVLQELVKERENYSKLEDFESANVVQQQINAVTYITQPFHKPFEYEVNPNLRDDIRGKELSDLQTALSKNGVSISSLKRIECFDISNIHATNTVGSMVVFTNGEKNASQYRRFKIHEKLKTPNDFAMMAQVIQRRLKHPEWEMPDLFIVDGGKGQISAALKVLDEHAIAIPLIGLAKKEEIIFTSDFKEIRLPKNSAAIHLITRIRDEAHRFAISYHRLLRSKSFLHG